MMLWASSRMTLGQVSWKMLEPLQYYMRQRLAARDAELDSPVPLKLVHGRFFRDEHVTPLEPPLLPPEARLERAIRHKDLWHAISSITISGMGTTHHIELLQLGGLHPSLTVPQADSEALGIVLNLVFPLHESHNGRDDEGRLPPGFRQQQCDRLDPASQSAPSEMTRFCKTGLERERRRRDTHVLPMPISSASIPPFHCPSSCFFIQYRLSFWNGKSLSLSDGCASIATGLTGVTLDWRSPHTLSSSG